MRTGQLQALSNTRHAKGHPFDGIDLSFGLLTAISGSPIAFALTIGQYFARRSAWVAETLLNAIELPPALEDTRLVRGLLPGVITLLPPPPEAIEEEGQATTESPLPSSEQAVPAAQQRRQVLTTDEWRDALDESPHLLVYGPSKAGKSTLAQAVVAMFRGCEYVVIDPQPNKPGERKWGGIDFITLDEHGADEYASIKTALARVKAEGDRRRRAMRTHTPRPLVVIIDEVLALVGALGTITNEEGKKEPRMAQFIRTMGYSARHRNIKIILIGQGKNLADLGLNSGTARNNYALVRAARNAATNRRSAFIDTPEGDQAIDLQQVPTLAGTLGGHAHVWLTHDQLAPREPASPSQYDDLLSSLLLGTEGSTTGKTGNQVPPIVPASECEVPPSSIVPVPPEELVKIAQLLVRNSPSKVIKMLDGYHPRKYDEYKAKVDAVVAILGTQPQPSDPDKPDPDEDVPPAFRGALDG
jgi:hypothetical protein